MISVVLFSLLSGTASARPTPTPTPMPYESKSDFRKRFEGELDQIGLQMSELQAKADRAQGRTKDELNAQVSTLKSKRDRLQSDLNKASDRTGRAWTRFRDGLERAMGELKSGFTQAKTELDESKKKPKPAGNAPKNAPENESEEKE